MSPALLLPYAMSRNVPFQLCCAPSEFSGHIYEQLQVPAITCIPVHRLIASLAFEGERGSV